ncbi:MAG: type IV secretion system protein VirB10 [Candidatus Accumulibacter sp.]|jgi:type IV secretion system protein VirB10|nr:type IV secretion system protein VirB10 [Accumulibacter sp.]
MAKTNKTEPLLDEINGERGLPSVNETRSFSAKRGLVFILVVLLIALAAGFIYMAQQRKKAGTANQVKDMQVTQAVPSRSFTFPPPPPPQPPPAPRVAEPIPVVPAPVAAEPVRPAAPIPSLQRPARPAQPEKPPAELDKSLSGLMVAQGSTRLAASRNTQPAQPESGPVTQGALANLLTGTTTRANRAGMLPDRNYLLAKGSFIDCVLKTRLDSTVPGMTACTVTRDIYSDNGKVLLIERGSTVSGEYRSNMRQGMARIFVLWTRITTQNGITINLDSPGADALGGSGVPGYVDTHFWDRFGGAILLSLIDDFARYVAQETSNGQTINFGGSGDSAKDVAAEALKNTINIPPTLYVNQGDRVGIYVARDLHFGEVYDLRAE